MTTIEFKQTGTFVALDAARCWLKDCGFSVGPSQADGPCAIWYGDYLISKWRNLSAAEKRQVHAIMEGNLREGPVRIKLMPAATPDAIAAFQARSADHNSEATNA